MSQAKPPKLGQGIAALLGGAGAREAGARTMPVGWLEPGRFQPRRVFGEGALEELADSIRRQGVLMPLLVRPLPDAEDRYEIVSGERRWRAAQRARLHDVPVIVREVDDRTALEIALVENVQRDNLTPVEEAEGYRRLREEFSYGQEDLARAVGRSRPHVANMLRLLSLPGDVLALVDGERLTAGHARALIGAPDPAGLARRVMDEGLSVRAVEALVAVGKVGNGKVGGRCGSSGTRKDPDTLALERDLGETLGLRVVVDPKGVAGTLTVHYSNLDQLDGVIKKLKT